MLWHTDTDTDKDKDKVLPRPNVCYIYQNLSIAEQSDSMTDDGIATTAWSARGSTRSPAFCQDSDAWSQYKIELNAVYAASD